MTNKLYYNSTYLTDWQTRVTETIEREDGLYVLLEETAFYPHGGGQPCDLGSIQGIPVLDVISEEELVLHKLERLPNDESVACQLDWNRRFDHMQQHSGQHLLSAVCLEKHNFMTLSFHLGEDYCTIDIEVPELNAGQLSSIEREVNRQIYLNHNILSYFVTGEEASQLKLVKQPKVTENIRIVEIKDVEYNACGGTHVSSTGEIGMIKLLKAEKIKGNTRIYFKCGYRALEEFNTSQQILGTLSSKFNTGKDEIIDRIEKWENEQKLLQAEINLLKEKNDDYVVQELLNEQAGKIIAQVFEDKSLKDLQSLANKLTSKCDLPVLLATSAENKVVFAQNGSLEISCGAFFKAHLGSYNGKGGGSDKLAQAGFPTREDALAFYEFARG
ncbi:DHHA1 domain-containing protein [Paenibacillus sp. FSL L8-0493]|uniref:alanyl-tRNA editing protein n=1 Tax=Paenibacillus TaxID=44249 RepID=UPI0004F6AA31|nr:DHHA1 domain-containing protein [Paenibacillus odorifer]AIQ74337.1 hydrolase [Paenibacillus odorifer]OMC96599.1 hydrolase [Paenibacillus odorifer]OMD03868.1 hydrolase [Paenibacillus odorifer]OMD15333.1 hydrolase [Paenibacillus odorifer]OZQ77793.1 hydrolase [Paenibacillus odorifer]